jgi:hypothetical protein
VTRTPRTEKLAGKGRDAVLDSLRKARELSSGKLNDREAGKTSGEDLAKRGTLIDRLEDKTELTRREESRAKAGTSARLELPKLDGAANAIVERNIAGSGRASSIRRETIPPPLTSTDRGAKSVENQTDGRPTDPVRRFGRADLYNPGRGKGEVKSQPTVGPRVGEQRSNATKSRLFLSPIETPLVESVQNDTRRIETPKVEPRRVETLKSESRRTEAPKVDLPRIDLGRKLPSATVESPRLAPSNDSPTPMSRVIPRAESRPMPRVETRRDEPRMPRIDVPRESRPPLRIETPRESRPAPRIEAPSSSLRSTPSIERSSGGLRTSGSSDNGGSRSYTPPGRGDRYRGNN